MTKMVFITDSHWRFSNVLSRTDNYCSATLDKLRWVVRYCKENKIGAIIHGGDMFDIPNVSDFVAGQVAGILGKSGLQVYFIIGNHDVSGKTKETYIHSKLAMFEHYDWFHFIGDKVIEFDDCYLSGHDYCKKHEEEVNFNMPEYKYDKVKTKVLVLHQMLTGNKKSMIVDGRRCMTSYRDIVTNADMILCGHYHPGIGLKKCVLPIEHTVYFANPGSLARTSVTENEIGAGPALTHICIDNGRITTFKNIPIPCDRTVFKDNGIKTKYDVGDYITDGFIEAMRAFKDISVVKDDISLLLKMWIGKGKEFNLPFEITDKLVDYVTMKVKEVEQCKVK